MTENSERRCTCTTPEITIKLNKQGPQGLTGPQGEPGFSPVIEVSEETPTSYRLSIQTLEGSYETPNLKANFPLGGYVNQVLVKQSNADGDATWDYIPYATTETTGGLTLATEDDVVVGSDKAITGDILAKVVAGYVDLTSTQRITGAKTFSQRVEVIGDIIARRSNGSSQRGEISTNFNGTTTMSVYTPSDWPGQMGVQEYNSDRRMWLQAPYQSSALYINNYADNSAPSGNANTVIISGSDIKSQRNSQTYTILDSGNISSDPYIQSLVARIEALES